MNKVSVHVGVDGTPCKVFLKHKGVIIWHHYKWSAIQTRGRALDFWYSVKPDAEDYCFDIRDLGIGGISTEMYPDLSISDKSHRWFEAVKKALIALIDSGHIKSGKLPEDVPFAISKCKHFSGGESYGYE
jgi:hypothetical protein